MVKASEDGRISKLKIDKARMKLDRTAFRITSIENKGRNVDYWLKHTVMERLSASWYLTCAAYDLPYRADIPMDKTAFRKRSHGE